VEYEVRNFYLKGLQGISDDNIAWRIVNGRLTSR